MQRTCCGHRDGQCAGLGLHATHRRGRPKFLISALTSAGEAVGSAQAVAEQTNASGHRSDPMLSNTGRTAAGSWLRLTRSGSTRITILPGRNADSAARCKVAAAGSPALPMTIVVAGYSTYS